MAAPRLRPHDPREYERLLEWVKGAKSVLEIGSRAGYTLYDMAHVMDGTGPIVSVDLPDAEGWNDEISAEAITHLRKNVQSLRDEGYHAFLFEGNSRSPAVIEAVQAFGPYDVIFIDGDHTYEGVKADWEHYRALGKVVIFHDIREPKPPEWMGLGVWKLWGEIKQQHKTEEFLAEGSKMGIGKVEC